MPALPDFGKDSSHAASSYFPQPVKSAVNSAFKRFSSEPLFSSSRSSRSRSQDPISSASSYSNLAQLDASNQTPPVAHTPPPRTGGSPFHPPPLTPLTLRGTSSNVTQVLATQIAEEIRLLLPARLQLCDSWHQTFSLERDGSSLTTLYDKCDANSGRRGGYVVVARDGGGGVFGAYLSDAPRPSHGQYYGTGECFLWRSTTVSSLPMMASLPPRPSEDTTHAVRATTIGSPTSPQSSTKRRSWGHKRQRSENLIDFGDNDDKNDDEEFGDFESHDDNDDFGDFEGPNEAKPPAEAKAADTGSERPRATNGTDTPDRLRFKAFPYSGENDYLIFCEHGFLSIGGGNGHYGLWLDASLEKGVSETCPTFGNEGLSEEGAKFEVIGVEVWYIGV